MIAARYSNKDWPVNVVAHEYPYIVDINDVDGHVDLKQWKEMKRWCSVHCRDWMEFLFNSGPSVFMFKHEGDAVLFSLKWT